jgi:hypothetical protein
VENVKLFLVSAFAAAVALGQDSSTYTKSQVDINGRRVTDDSQIVSRAGRSASEVTEKTQSINGREVPLEKVEEHVVRDDAGGKVIERLIKRYDPTGNAMLPTKQIIEEQKQPGGGSTIRQTTYQGDVNGRLQLSEKSVTQKQTSGSTETADTVVERPTLNGGFETVDRRSVVRVKEPNGYQESTTTYRRTENGEFHPAAKVTVEHVENGPRSTENAAEYEIGPLGELRLHTQKVQTTVKRPDGSEDVQLNVFGQNVVGRAGSIESDKLTLQEQDIIERKRVSRDAVVESFSLRRPTIADPNQLGPLQHVSETTCRGKCEPDKQ